MNFTTTKFICYMFQISYFSDNLFIFNIIKLSKYKFNTDNTILEDISNFIIKLNRQTSCSIDPKLSPSKIIFKKKNFNNIKW